MTRLACFHPRTGAALARPPDAPSALASFVAVPVEHLADGADEPAAVTRLALRLADNHAQNGSQSVVRIRIQDMLDIANAYGCAHNAHLQTQVFELLRLAVNEIAEVDHASAIEFVIIPQGAEASRLETSTILLTFANELLNFPHKPIQLGNCIDWITGRSGIPVATCNSTAKSLYEEVGIAANRYMADANRKLDADLRTAIADGQFALYAQPQVDTTDHSLIGHELLVRWNHPELGLLPPSEFICRAEKTGLIREIDTWMIEQACSLLGRWACTTKSAAWRLSVNVSRAHLCDSDFVDKVEAIIENSGAPVSRLTLEITETMVFDDFGAALRNMTRLRHMGLSLSLDDFGTGFSSINMIRQLPFTEIKIDQAFVADLPHNLRASKIVANMISLAQALGLDVIAEGVETAAQEKWLLENGCRLAQGYLFGRPEAMNMCA